MDEIRYIFTHHLDGVIFGAFGVLQFIFNMLAYSLPAPTKDDTKGYIIWFRAVNYCALNFARGKGPPRIEDSPNFIAAAEQYMAEKLAAQQGGSNAPTQ